MTLRLYEVEELTKGEKWVRSLKRKRKGAWFLQYVLNVFIGEGEGMKESSQRINYT